MRKLPENIQPLKIKNDVERAKEKNQKRVEKLIEVSPEQKRLIDFMNSKGISAKTMKELLESKDSSEQEYEIDEWELKFKFGVVSDTHLVAKNCMLKELHDFYNLAYREGVRRFFHSGDLTDGMGGVYKGQLREIKVFGADDTAKYVQENYPNPHWECVTEFINGNHDEDYLKQGWVDIWEAITRLRDDMNYLGFYDATVNLNGMKIGLHHWAGGWSYAKSYKIQKFVEAIVPKKKPRVYILWHYHQSLYMMVQDVHSILPWSFQGQGDFAVRLWLSSCVGGYIVEIELTKDKQIRSFLPKYISYT